MSVWARLAMLFALLGALAWPSIAQRAGRAPAPTLALQHGDTLCLVGSALADRMQHDGGFEARLQSRFPELELSVRNLGFAADELTVQQRTAGFGSMDEHLERCGADVILAFFGNMESFSGDAGLPDFRADLDDFIDHVGELDFGEGAPQLVLISPTPPEDTGDVLLPSVIAQRGRLAPYVEALRAVAAGRGVPFVDVFTPLTVPFAAARRATINGIHLNGHGHALLAEVLEQALFGAFDHDAGRLERLRAAVLAKNAMWFNRYRATDGYNVYGGRSSLEYDGVTNYEVLQQELTVLDALTAWHDGRIHALARGETPEPLERSDDASLPAGIPPPPSVDTNRPGPGPDGSYEFLTGEQGTAAMTPGQGLAVQLFASEEQFAQLANPVQMSFDPAGRLWVAVWPSYPHWQPGRPMDDKLLVFEDQDADGRADVCTVFADGLRNPTGFEFWNGGVLVAAAPDILFLTDTDGDGRADSTERVLQGLSSGDTHHSANSFLLGPDGALYFQEGIFHQSQVESIRGPVRNTNGCVWRFDPRSWSVERYIAYDFLNPHGHVFDRWGQDFVTDGTGNQNYYALPFSGHVEAPDKHSGYFTFFPQRSRPAAATEILSSDHFPDQNQGSYLIANVIGFQGLFQYRLSDDGSGFSATELEPLVHSTDPNFRPVDVEVGPDGAVWFLDWHNPLIGHMQHHLRDPSRDHEHGRVYRIAAEGRPLSISPAIAGRPLDELIPLLAHDEDRVRYRVRIELSGRDRAAVVAGARAWVDELDAAQVTDPDLEHHLLEALWLQQQHGVLDQALLERLLAADDFRARAAAVRVLLGLRQQVTSPLDLLAVAITDEHPRVRLQAVVAASAFPDARAAEIALRAVDADTDRFLDYALSETLEALAPHWQAALAAGKPFAAEHPAGLAWALSRLDTDDLAAVAPSEVRSLEMLGRHGLSPGAYASAVLDLARRRGAAPADEWLAAVRRADEATAGYTDHLLSGLYATLPELPSVPADMLVSLADTGKRATTRRLATVARMVAEGSTETAWAEGQSSAEATIDLLEAAMLLDDIELAAQLQPRVWPLLDAAAASQPVAGRSVRIELPGEGRTLTLAEVQVFSGGSNVAARGVARQSSTNWEGVAQRAVDGNTSGVFADGGQTHTLEDQPDPWWELDLGAELPLDRITIWNRTEGEWGGRLEGYTLRIGDDEGRVVYEAHDQPAPAPSASVEVLPAEIRLRRTAVATLVALAARGTRRDVDAVADALIGRLGDEQIRDAIVAGLAQLPLESLSGPVQERLQRALLELLEVRSEAEFRTPAGRQLLALADDLLEFLDEEAARALFRLRRERGPQVVVIRPVRDALLYDRTEFTVVAGRPIELVFDNVDIMPHNLVLTVPGALATVGLAAEGMAADPGAWDRAFVPDRPEVLTATGLLQPGQSQTLVFDAPAAVGDYPYVCTFPGHWVRMNGVMHVMESLADVPFRQAGSEPTTAAAATPAARAFVRNWTSRDLRRDLDGVDGASPSRGRELFETAACLLCHRIAADDAVGGRAGPPLAEAVGRYDRADLLAQILEPSATLADGYATEIFITTDGRVVAGRVVAEDEAAVHIQDNPYQADTLTLPRDRIAERRTSAVSAMPEELLSTFERDEILDLLAYLESLGASGRR